MDTPFFDENNVYFINCIPNQMEIYTFNEVKEICL